MVTFYALVALCFSSGALAQMAGWGSCPDMGTMEDLNIRNIQGRWYEAGRYFSLGGVMLKCVTSDLLHGGGHGIIQMNTTAISQLTGKMLSVKGIKVRQPDVENPGKLEVQMPSSSIWLQYWILGSDVDSWMVGYSCVDMKLIHLKYVWISTRQQEATDKVMKKVLKVLKKHKLSDKIMMTDQTNCVAESGSDESDSNSDSDEDDKDVHILF